MASTPDEVVPVERLGYPVTNVMGSWRNINYQPADLARSLPAGSEPKS
jgi:hypothetical protein